MPITLAGTYPQPNIRFTQDMLTLSPEIEGDAFTVPYPPAQESMNAGTHPQTNILGADIDASGLSTVIEAESFTAIYRMCGTRYPGE
jgi:hypothetical protein